MDTEMMELSRDPRKKGDIFWKKYKLMESAKKEKGGGSDHIGKQILLKEILRREKTGPADAEEKLTGYEFHPYPATPVGQDVTISGIVRAMRAVEGLKLREEGEELAGLIREAVSYFFHTYGFERDAENTVSEEERNADKEKLSARISSYKNAVRRVFGTDEAEEVGEIPENTFAKHRLWLFEYADFEDEIPPNYLAQLKSGTLNAATYYDEDEILAGLVITAEHDRWQELVWITPGEGYKDLEKLAVLLRYLIREARESGQYCGVFAEMHMIPGAEQMLRVLKESGMTVSIEYDNIYQAVLSDVECGPTLAKAAKRIHAVPIEKLDDEMKQELEEALLQDKKPIPASVPIPWGSYRQDISFAYKKNRAVGLFLVSEEDDCLVTELLYGSDPLIMASLVARAAAAAKQKLGEDQKLLVPIVNEATRPLAAKLIPNAKRGQIAQAVVWF